MPPPWLRWPAPAPVGAAAALLVAVMLPIAWRHTRRSRSRDWHRRGTRVERAHQGLLLRLRRFLGASSSLTLAGVGVDPRDECKHFKLIGTTGTGKSTAIRELLRGALRRGDRAVISDPDGGYARRFGERYRGDVLLSPFESGAYRWDLFGELRDAYDAEHLASALIPSVVDSAAQEWRGYARTFLSALLRHCARRTPEVAELWRLAVVASGDELRPLVLGTAVQPFLEPDNARMFGSIRSVASSAVSALEYIVAQRGAPLAVRDWVREGHGVLFIPYRAGQIAALRTIIAAWMRLAIFEVMKGPEDHDQRIWFVVDELDALGAIDGLKDALARLRKFGGRCVLGFQSVAQVGSTYGHGDGQTIIENCATTLIFRCSSSEQGGTAQFASRLIGEREVARRQYSRARDRQGIWPWDGARSSTQIGEQRVIESAVLASEIEQLPDLCGYLKTASRSSWSMVRVRVSPRH